MLESCPNALDKKLVVEWPREELHRTCSHSLRPHLFITVRRDEDVGIWQHSAFNLACKSRPDIPGILISAIRHAVLC